MKIFIVDIREKQAGRRVQAEHGRQTKLDRKRREGEGEQERSSQPKGGLGQEVKRPG